ncbi:MAG TPA: acyl-CoA thioesterase [Panacibacter sp.]|nr:acyl-CoA thioesterase [Panacibacter sp.]HNP46256.1 acyl-CoA thioesterase [Panacibacter sp.]
MELKNSHYKKTIIVQPQHLDEVQHVNNVIYVQWMQDIAAEHWNTFVSEKLKNEVLWMIKRHEVDYFNQAFLGDELQMETWTGDYTNVTWKRHYGIIRPADNKKIISAASVWIPLDRKTQRPKKIDEEMINMFA